MNEHIKNIVDTINGENFFEKLKEQFPNDSDVKIYIADPLLETQKNKLHFLIETKKNINLFEFANLEKNLKTILKYEEFTDGENFEEIENAEYLLVLNKNLFLDEKIKKLFNCLVEVKKENLYSIIDLIKKNHTELTDRIVEQLKKDSKLWEEITKNPSSLDGIKNKLNKELFVTTSTKISFNLK